MTPYEKIDKYLTQHEKGRYKVRSLDNIALYIDWAWKWRKITYDEMMKFTNRVIRLTLLD